MTSEIVTIVGLLMAMLGTAMIFVWGPPQPDFDETVGRAVEDATVLADGTKVSDIVNENRRRKRKHQFLSRCGLGLIFFGFAAQLWAIWLN